MSRVAPSRLVAVVLTALIGSALALVAPAHADIPLATPGPTRVQIYPDNLLDDVATLYLAANVFWGDQGRDDGVTGTFTFRDDTGAVLATDVPVSVENGYGVTYVPKPTRPTTYYVDFHGTGGWGDSTDSALYYPSSRRTVTVTPEATILKITAGSPQLTLTLSARARFNDGTGAPGVAVSFDGPCLLRDPVHGFCQSQPLHWCTAVSDDNGFASCRGSGLLGSIVSILKGSVVMTASSPGLQYRIITTNDYPPVVVRS
ncbi:MAG: hypothetical protein ACJ72E_08570 [Marmoricola sp.]